MDQHLDLEPVIFPVLGEQIELLDHVVEERGDPFMSLERSLELRRNGDVHRDIFLVVSSHHFSIGQLGLP